MADEPEAAFFPLRDLVHEAVVCRPDPLLELR